MGLELADLFQAYGADYRKKYVDKLLPSHRLAMWAIESCRTERLGGQVFGCEMSEIPIQLSLLSQLPLSQMSA
jgi:hypothetical protein